VMETTESLGSPMCLSDLMRYFMGKMSPGSECSDGLLKSANMHVPVILDVLSQYPRFAEELIKVGNFEKGSFNKKLAEELTSGDYLERRFLPGYLRTNEAPRTTVYSYTDPVSGQNYKTNQSAIDKTHDQLTEHAYKVKALKAAPLLGTSAVLGANALAKGFQGRPSRKAAILSGLGSLVTGAAGVHQITKPTTLDSPSTMTNEGKPISGWTEMVRTAAKTAPEINYMIKRATDRPSESLPSAYKADLVKRIKMAELEDTYSNILGPTLDLDQVAQTIGDSIIRWMP